MNDDLSKRVLSMIMDWDDDRARKEYQWLEFFSRLKYDGYRDFQAGMRFIESLAVWLQQFEAAEREVAYQFVRSRLVFIGLSETHHLVEQFYPKVAHEQFTRVVSARHSVPKWTTLSRQELREEIAQLRRKTLFLGLSDGARIDVLRHSNAGRLSNEQIAPTIQLDHDKWDDLLKDMRADVGDNEARFSMVYLIDDFTATGTSFLRYDKNQEKWKGKLARFRDTIAKVKDSHLEPSFTLGVHHYIASYSAQQKIESALSDSSGEFSDAGWGPIQLSFGTVLPAGLPMSDESDADSAFLALARKYYDPAVETKHTEVGGTKHVDLGYGGCALPVVLEHNTPNNSLALLWAESAGQENPPIHAMRPLFRRRQRHV